jgi:hypothetical protein
MEKKPKTQKTEAAVAGKTAPTEPPEKVSKKDQKLLMSVVPARGFFLGRLIGLREREKLGSTEDNNFLSREYPVGSWVFASLEEIAPLLSTFVFLVPNARIQGHFPTDVSEQIKKHGIGFQGA